MNPTTAPAAFGPLDVLYIEDVSGTKVKIVFAPEMRATQAELSAAMADIKERKSVFDVYQDGAKSDSFAITVQFEQHAANTETRKALLFEQLAPRYVLGRAWGNIIRNDGGKHLSTFLRIDVARWAAEPVIERLRGGIAEVAQFSTVEEYKDCTYITGIGFTMRRPTRDPALNRAAVATVAELLGVQLTNPQFTIQENLAYASIPECNRDDDPVDDRPGDAT